MSSQLDAIPCSLSLSGSAPDFALADMAIMPVQAAATNNTDTTSRLDALSELLHARAEIFANPSIELENGTSSIHKQTLEAVKYLFDACTLP